MTHHRRILGFGNPAIDKATQGYPGGYFAIRGREQQLIDFYGGVRSPGLANLIRGVSPINPLGRAYHNASNAYFGPLSPNSGF